VDSIEIILKNCEWEFRNWRICTICINNTAWISGNSRLLNFEILSKFGLYNPHRPALDTGLQPVSRASKYNRRDGSAVADESDFAVFDIGGAGGCGRGGLQTAGEGGESGFSEPEYAMGLR
jgi:hypothetical protein